MMRRIAIFTFLALLCNIGLSQDMAELFAEGNSAYQDGAYQEAYEKYQAILANGRVSAELYYNLGNTAYRLNRLGEAILCLERSLLLAPGDSDSRHNLRLLKERRVDRLELPPQPWLLRNFNALKRLVVHPAMDLWLGLSFLFLSLLAISLWYLFAVNHRFILIGVLFVLLLSWSGVFALWNLGHAELASIERGILLKQRTAILAAPDANAERLFILHAGAEFVIQRENGQWLEIEIVDGKKGWLKKSDTGLVGAL
jgi:tetratricopeptide (TPR) repeat protein